MDNNDKQKRLKPSNEASSSSSSSSPKRFNELPLYKLTLGLRQLYKAIDDYDKNHAGIFIINKNEPVIGNYTIINKVGSGTFGQVFYAFHTESKQEVAIKIINSKKVYTKQAQHEIKILTQLKEEDHPCIVKLLDQFQFNYHQCLVFEKLSINLYQLLVNTSHEGISLDLIRKFGKQILHVLSFLKQNNIIHCDLKPENIVLVNQRCVQLKVIDFGSSCTTTERPHTYIQSRFYRAPEVILGCDYSCAIDIFSSGCILLEMHTGRPLFPGANQEEQMYLFCNSKGLPPENMLQSGKFTKNFFDHDSNTNTFTLKPLDKTLKKLKPLTIDRALGINENPDSTAPFLMRKNTESIERYKEFSDLLESTLNYSPDRRITPAEGLQHVFFSHIVRKNNDVSPSATTDNTCAEANNKRYQLT